MADRLRPLWDFDDLDGSERRFEDQLQHETSGAGRAEVLTQLARVQGLRGTFKEGERLIEQAEALSDGSAVVHARIEMERGRLHNSSGDAVSALAMFEAAFEIADQAGEKFLAADAAHMAALASPDPRASSYGLSEASESRPSPLTATSPTGSDPSTTTSGGSTRPPASTRRHSTPSSAPWPRGSDTRRCRL